MMMEQPESPTASRTNQQVFDHYLYRLQNEIHSILSRQALFEERALSACTAEKESAERVRALESELGVWKRAYEDVVRAQGEKDKGKDKDGEPGKPIANRMAIIDGDSLLFHTYFVRRGRDGGREAVGRLIEAISRYTESGNVSPSSDANTGQATSNASPSSSSPSSASSDQNLVSVYIYIFFNKEELVNSLLINGSICLDVPNFFGFDPVDIRECVDEFVRGVNNAGGKSERVLMVDLGSDEGVVSKVGAFLEDSARSKETQKIFFGSSFVTDNSNPSSSVYLTKFKELANEGLKEKIVLLSSAVGDPNPIMTISDNAGLVNEEIKKIGLETLPLPELFLGRLYVPRPELIQIQAQTRFFGRRTPVNGGSNSNNANDLQNLGNRLVYANGRSLTSNTAGNGNLGPPPGLGRQNVNGSTNGISDARHESSLQAQNLSSSQSVNHGRVQSPAAERHQNQNSSADGATSLVPAVGISGFLSVSSPTSTSDSASSLMSGSGVLSPSLLPSRSTKSNLKSLPTSPTSPVSMTSGGTGLSYRSAVAATGYQVGSGNKDNGLIGQGNGKPIKHSFGNAAPARNVAGHVRSLEREQEESAYADDDRDVVDEGEAEALSRTRGTAVVTGMKSGPNLSLNNHGHHSSSNIANENAKANVNTNGTATQPGRRVFANRQNDINVSMNINGNHNNGKARRINRNIPLSRHDPPPCTLYYLAKNGCTNEQCKFGHEYVLEDEDYDTLYAVAKKIPCSAANRDEHCLFGEDCCYGHVCPLSPKCKFYREGRCKFVGTGMHLEES